MRNFVIIICLAIFCSACSNQIGRKTYEISTAAPDIVTSAEMRWNGDILFTGVYCATAPMPELATKHTARMYSNNRIYLGTVYYPNNLMVAVAFSKFPKSITSEEHIAAQFELNSKAFASHSIVQPDQHHLSLNQTDFGSTIRLMHKNIEAHPEGGPFPLIINTYSTLNDSFQSMAVRQIFARDDDLFEVAAIQTKPEAGFTVSEAEIESQLNSFVKDLTSSLQRCTRSMRERIKTSVGKRPFKYSFSR
ncbi:hypothetical protein [Ottowia thiooxydans]|uniref:Lipoprotein n=1 Tax=Ottowia thiooxydans TaxID=219182 RepID=A0ABV2Q6T0_9BURK